MPSVNPSTGYVALSREAIAGTAIASPDFFYPFQNVDIEMDDEVIEWQEIALSRQAKVAVDGALRPSVTFGGAVYPAGAMVLLLEGALGKRNSALKPSGTLAMEHKIVDDARLPTFTVERASGALEQAGALGERIAGCKIESLGFEFAFGEQVTFNATMQAFKQAASVTPVAKSAVVFPTVKPLYFQGSTVKVAGLANSKFKTLSLELSNTLTREETLNESRLASDISEGAMEVSLSGTMQFDDMTFKDYLKNGTEISFSLHCHNGQTIEDTTKYGIDFVFPSVRVIRCSTPYTAGETVEADVELKVLFDRTLGYSVAPVITNSDAGSVYD